MSSVVNQIKNFMNTCQYEPWKTYCPYLYRQSREPVFSASTPPPTSHELQLNQATTSEEMVSFLAHKNSHFNDRRDVYFWIESSYQQDSNYHISTIDGTNELKGLEYPKSISFKTAQDFHYVSIEIPWVQQSNTVFSLTLPTMPKLLDTLLSSILPPEHAMGVRGQLHIIKHFLIACGVGHIPPIVIRDIKPILYSCNYDGFLEPKPMSEFFLEEPTTPQEENDLQTAYTTLLLIEKLHLIGGLYLLVKVAPIPAILAYVTKEQPNTLAWTILDYINQEVSVSVNLNQNSRSSEKTLGNLHLLSTPWKSIGTSTAMSLVSVYVQSKRVKLFLEDTGQDDSLLMYHNQQTVEIHKDKKIHYNKSLPKHNLNILRSSNHYSSYREYLSESSHISDELFILSLLHQAPIVANEKFRFRDTFLPTEFNLQILYFLHIAFPQTTLDEEEKLLRNGEKLQMFTINYHKRRPVSP